MSDANFADLRSVCRNGHGSETTHTLSRLENQVVLVQNAA